METCWQLPPGSSRTLARPGRGGRCCRTGGWSAPSSRLHRIRGSQRKKGSKKKEIKWNRPEIYFITPPAWPGLCSGRSWWPPSPFAWSWSGRRSRRRPRPSPRAREGTRARRPSRGRSGSPRARGRNLCWGGWSRIYVWRNHKYLTLFYGKSKTKSSKVITCQFQGRSRQLRWLARAHSQWPRFLPKPCMHIVFKLFFWWNLVEFFVHQKSPLVIESDVSLSSPPGL